MVVVHWRSFLAGTIESPLEFLNTAVTDQEDEKERKRRAERKEKRAIVREMVEGRGTSAETSLQITSP